MTRQELFNDYLTENQLAELFEVDTPRIGELRRDGLFTCYRVTPRRYLFKADDINEYILNCKVLPK